ncbi:hypothetical protein C8J56DRAFT_1165386 [Mycena floridula]|nr:hypothetical protein C8J56DRAFT_1165386 [Mycena floridula]
MSANFAAATAANQWMKENKWTGDAGSHNLPVILLPAAVSNNLASGPFQVQNGFGIFELDTVYDSATEALQKLSLFLVIPVWGREKLLDNVNIPLKDPKEIEVNIPETGIVGKVKFSHDTEKKEILLSWMLNIPWAGELNEGGLSLFSTSVTTNFTEEKLKRARCFSSAEIEALATPASHFQVLEGTSGKYWKVVRDDLSTDHPTTDQKLLKSFISDFVISESQIVAVQTYNAASSKQFAIDLSFLGILTLVGSIDPRSLTAALTLYVNFPLWGRVNIAEIAGSLITGIAVQVDVILAKGTVKLYVKDRVLYINAALDLKFLGHFETGDLRLIPLPF